IWGLAGGLRRGTAGDRGQIPGRGGGGGPAMRKMSRRIVVDASVARSAGSTEHPASVASRQFLQEMLAICHRVVMTDEIEQEWKRHRSGFATSWLATMRSKGKWSPSPQWTRRFC